MSILIKNMEMPKCCDICQFCAWSSFHQTAACEVHDNDPCFDDFSVEYREKRSNICPLVKFSENEDAISRQGAIDVAFDVFPDDEYFREQFVKSIEALPSVQPETCKGCKHLNKWEDEVEYGYPSPCTGCKRRAGDRYER